MAKNTSQKNESQTDASATSPAAGGAGGNPPAQTTSEPKVELPKATLEKILKRIEDLETSHEEDQKTITRLVATADKGRLSHYDSKEGVKSELITRAKVGFFDGQAILGWAKVKDEVGFRNGRLEANQIIKLFLDTGEGKDPETRDVDYLFWAQNTSCQEGEVTSKSQTKEGTFWTIEMPDGRVFALDIRFINPF